MHPFPPIGTDTIKCEWAEWVR